MSLNSMKNRRGALTLTVAAVGLSAALGLSGCAAPSATDGPTEGDVSAEFLEKVDSLWQDATGPVEPPSQDAGPALTAGASIGAACLGSQITACVQWWEQVEAVGALIGWTVTQYDGKIDPVVWNAELTRAANAGHDGILVFGGVPSLSAEGLAAIAEAGVPLVGMTSDDPEGVQALSSRLDGGIADDNFEIGYLQGVAAYKIGEGIVHAIGGYDGSEISVARQSGFESFVDECKAAGGDCWAELRPTDTAQMFTQIEQYCPSLAQVNPDFNVMVSQVDDITAICVDAVKQAGLLKQGDFGVGVDFNSISAQRIAPDSDFLASVAVPYPSGAWEGVDELNRLINGDGPLADRAWVKRIFYPGNIDTIDTSSDEPWDVQLFEPEERYSTLWALN
jgi:ribose transport system substrate-binding protein